MRKVYFSAGLAMVAAAGLWAGLALGDDPLGDVTSGPLPFTIERVSVASDGTQANDWSTRPAISADGRYVAFESQATNLVPGDTTGLGDVFVHDRDTGETKRVSIASDGTPGNGVSFTPSISDGGRYVAFGSAASNLVPSDSNGTDDVFVYDRETEETERVSVPSKGGQGDRVSYGPFINADGRYVAFESQATNLVPGDTNGWGDVFVYDRETRETELVSLAFDGAQGNDISFDPSISADGRHVAFWSFAINLVPGDTNGKADVFVRDRQTQQTERVSLSSSGVEGDQPSRLRIKGVSDRPYRTGP